MNIAPFIYSIADGSLSLFQSLMNESHMNISHKHKVDQKKSDPQKSILCIIRFYAFLREGEVNDWKRNTRGFWGAGDVLVLESNDDYSENLFMKNHQATHL